MPTPKGTLAARELSALCRAGGISSPAGIAPEQIQPSSIDLSLAAEAWRMPGSALPLPGEKVSDIIRDLAVERLDLSKPTCLARDHVYLVRLRERFALEAEVEGYTNSKSSTGRIDLATRSICDGSTRYDRIPRGYQGDVWVELIPRSFDVVVQEGDLLNQVIIFRDRQILSQENLLTLPTLLFEPDASPTPRGHNVVDGRILMSVDLSGPIAGWRARSSFKPVVVRSVGTHRDQDYFEPITRLDRQALFLEQDSFYILVTWERIAVPADLASEMVPYDASAGDFRAHYAGFFDPGWGIEAGRMTGRRAVLEVRPHADDLILRHRQVICAMAYERLTSPSDMLYGTRSNNYATQDGPKLSKHFFTSP